jgi:integrase
MNTYETNAAKPRSIRMPIRKLLRPDRPSPFLLQWSRGGATKTESFRTSEERDYRYEEILKEQNQGNENRVFTNRELNELAAFKEAIGDNHWVDVVSGWKEYLIHTGRVTSDRNLTDAVEEYIKDIDLLVLEKKLTWHSFQQKRKKLRQFGAMFRPSHQLSKVTPQDITNFIEKKVGTKPGTFNTTLKYIRTFFNANRKYVPSSPAHEVKMRDDSIDDVGIISPKETATLFSYALRNRPETLGRLSLEAFAGLRFSSAANISKDEINFADKGITLQKHKIKTRRRHYIDGLPDNLWDWITKTTEDCWAMDSKRWMHVKSQLFIDAGVPHPHNCLRHSFCTYHVSAYKNPGLTATLLCHQNQSQLWGHYNGRASQAAGLTYFSITPENVEQLAQGELKAA